MARIEVPLLGKVLRTTGDVLLRAELDVLVKTNRLTWEPAVFLVDSGTEMTSIHMVTAQQLDLPFPQQPMPGLRFQPTREEVRAGVLRAQVIGMGSTEFVFPCYFVGDPNAPTTSKQSPKSPRNLLGLTGVVDKLRITFDGDAAPGSPYGNLILESN